MWPRPLACMGGWTRGHMVLETASCAQSGSLWGPSESSWSNIWLSPLESWASWGKGNNTYFEATRNYWNARVYSVVRDIHLAVSEALKMISLWVWVFFVAYSGARSVTGSARCVVPALVECVIQFEVIRKKKKKKKQNQFSFKLIFFFFFTCCGILGSKSLFPLRNSNNC